MISRARARARPGQFTIGAKRLAKRDLPRRESLQKMKAAAGLIGILADATHRGNVLPTAN
jgi:hypothetical protein